MWYRSLDKWVIRDKIKANIMSYGPIPILDFSLLCGNQMSPGNLDHIRTIEEQIRTESVQSMVRQQRQNQGFLQACPHFGFSPLCIS